MTSKDRFVLKIKKAGFFQHNSYVEGVRYYREGSTHSYTAFNADVEVFGEKFNLHIPSKGNKIRNRIGVDVVKHLNKVFRIGEDHLLNLLNGEINLALFKCYSNDMDRTWREALQVPTFDLRKVEGDLEVELELFPYYTFKGESVELFTKQEMEEKGYTTVYGFNQIQKRIHSGELVKPV